MRSDEWSDVAVATWDTEATRELARFVANTVFDDVAPEATEEIKEVILDTLGVTIAGTATRVSASVTRVGARYGGTGVSTHIGTTAKSDPATAAWINGTAAHALDYDDVSFAASAHPSVSLLPAVLALGEEEGSTGREVITAYAVGFEVAVLLGRTMNPAHYAHGWHGTGTVGSIAATVAAASLLKLDETQTLSAIALAASSAAGLRQNFGTDVKPIHAGNSGRTGVLAARLAQEGVVGSDAAIEGENGLLRVLSPGTAQAPERPDGTLGSPWAVQHPGINTKLFPACASMHPAVWLVLEMRRQGLRAADVSHLVVTLPPIAAGNLRFPRPTTGLEAKFSLEYGVARALVDGRLLLDHFTDDAVASSGLADLMEKVEMVSDPTLGADRPWGAQRPARLTVVTAAGARLSQETDVSPGMSGHRSRPMLHEKFSDCAQRGAVAVDTDRVIALTETLDRCDDIRELTALVGG